MTEPAPTRLAATILLARDRASDGALELCMVIRHHEIDFASGALVFPGGSIDPADHDARALCDGADNLADDTLALRVGAIREAFEECGILLARRDGTMVKGAEATRLIADWREKLEAREVTMPEIAMAEGLTLATDLLTPFSHWVTPGFMKKRFDTHFFIVKAPEDHALAHDGGEAVASVWINPTDAIAEGKAGTKTVIFATWLNLEMAAEAANTTDALARAAARAPIRVEPSMEMMGQKRIMRLPPGAGYRADAFLVESLTSEPLAHEG